MGFVPITIEKYIKKHLQNNPSENENDLRKYLNTALDAYKKGIKCACGNDIWVIGSAFAGNACFTCITGESQPDNDYEIDLAIVKHSPKAGQNHIDQIDKNQIHGIFDDDGFEINADLIKKPSLCLTCVHDDDPKEELFCNMNRYDQKDEKAFVCFAFRKKLL